MAPGPESHMLLRTLSPPCPGGGALTSPAVTVTSGDPCPQRELQVPFSPTRGLRWGPAAAGREQYFCSVAGGWGPGGFPDAYAQLEELVWGELGGKRWPPQGAPRPLDTPLRGGDSCRGGVPDAPATGLPTTPPPNPTRESQASLVLSCRSVPLPSPVRPLLPEPLLGFPTAVPTERPQVHLFTVTTASQRQGAAGLLTAVSQMPGTAPAT